LLDRLEYARDLGIGPEHAGRIHAARLSRLVDEGAIMTVQHIAYLEPVRWTAIFMGRAWDRSGLGFDPDTWRAVFRVLKPGAHMLCFGGTRTAHRMSALRYATR
jgi:hypothetical protein